MLSNGWEGEHLLNKSTDLYQDIFQKKIKAGTRVGDVEGKRDYPWMARLCKPYIIINYILYVII